MPALEIVRLVNGEGYISEPSRRKEAKRDASHTQGEPIRSKEAKLDLRVLR